MNDDQAVDSARPGAILIIEDDPIISKLLRVVLEHQGHRVEVADNFAEAMRLVDGEAPAAIVLDLNLPDGSGLDVLRHVRDDLKSATPVVVLTAFRQEDKALRAFELGADDFVTKPFSARELVARVQRVLSPGPSGVGSAAGYPQLTVLDKAPSPARLSAGSTPPRRATIGGWDNSTGA